MNKKKFQCWVNCNFAITCIFLAILGYIGVSCYISDSEFWAITQAKELFNSATDQIGLYYKIPFYLLLNLPHILANNNTDVIIFSRVIFIVISWLVVVCTYHLALEVIKSRRGAFACIFLLISTTYYAAHSIRVRSDILSGLFFLCLLGIILYTKRRNWVFGRWTLLLFCGLSFLLMLTTPKSIFFGLIIFFILLWQRQFIADSMRPAMNRLFLCLLLPIGVLIVSVAIAATFGHQGLYQAYVSALDFFKNNFLVGFTDFYSLKVFAIYNPLYSMVFVLTIIWGAKEVFFQIRNKLAPEARHFIFLANIMACIIMSVYSPRLQFFIAAWLPLTTLQVTIYLYGLTVRFRLKKIFLSGVIFYCFLMSVFSMWFVVKNVNNFTQLEVVQKLEKYLEAVPDAKYYDSIGLLPLRHQDYVYISPFDGKYNEHAQRIIKNSPDIIVMSARVTLVLDRINKFLLENYIEIGRDFWVKKIDSKNLSTNLANSTNVTNNNRFLEIDVAVLLYELLKDNVVGETVYVYSPDVFGLSKPSAFSIHHVRGVVANYDGSIDLNDLYMKLKDEGESLTNYAVKILPDAQSLSAFPPYPRTSHLDNFKLLFSYDSAF